MFADYVPSREVLFYCEGSRQRGFGHVGRCLAVAHALRNMHDIHCRFIFHGDAAAARILGESFPTTCLDSAERFADWHFAPTEQAEGLVRRSIFLDLCIPLADTVFSRARAQNVLLATLDDSTTNRLYCDLAFYPPVPQVQELEWEGFSGTLLCSWEYIPLRREFVPTNGINLVPLINKTTPELLVTMGGSDPLGFTLRVLRVLVDICTPWHATVIVGPLNKDLGEINKFSYADKRITVQHNVHDMAPLMRTSHAAIAAFGMTAYELAACATPQLLLCLTDDHARSASALHNTGAAISLGRHDTVTDNYLFTVLHELLTDSELRAGMRAKAATLDVKDGAANIATTIFENMEKRCERLQRMAAASRPSTAQQGRI